MLLFAAVAVAGLVLWPSGDDDPAPPKVTGVRLVSIPPLGLAFAHPTSWTRTVRGRAISLRSRDRSMQMIFSSPLNKKAPKAAKAATKRALTERFAPAKVVRDGPGNLGSRQVPTFELVGRDGKSAVRALVLVDASAYRTYVVTVLSGERPSARGLREATQILESVRLSKPLPSKR